MAKKMDYTYKDYIKSIRSVLEKDFEKESQDLLLSKLLTALNKKDKVQANKLYKKFNRLWN